MPKQNISASDYPQAVIQQIELLAQNIVVARKRRKETQAQWAQRLGVSQPTMARIEKGDPSVAMASYVMCVWLINPSASIADLIAPQHDAVALEREVAKVRPRARAQKNPVSFANPPAGMAVAPPQKAIDRFRVVQGTVSGNPKELQELQDQRNVEAIARSKALESIGDIHKLSGQQSTADAIRNLGLGSVADLQKFNDEQSAVEIARGKVIGAIGEMHKLSEQQSIAEAIRNLGLGSVADLQKFNDEQSAVEVARGKAIGAIGEMHKLSEQQSIAEAVRNLGLGTLADWQKFHDQQNAAEIMRSLDPGSVRTAAGLAALIAKAPGPRK